MTKQQKLVLVISILASIVAFLDGSVINVALPAITKDLGGGLVAQQWIVDAYLITLGSLMLIAGSLSDIFGRKKILTLGLYGFLIASILCALAPNVIFLEVSRGLQGLAGALLVPSSLAMIISAFSGSAQGKAIGTWTAWTGISFIIGPLVGGILVDASSWRWIFIINILPITITLWLVRGLELKESKSEKVVVDWLGALYSALTLGGIVFALIEGGRLGWGSPKILIPLIVGVVALGLFVRQERSTKQPMLPLGLFKVRNFWVGNLATVLIYGGLSVATFVIVIFLQQVANYSAFKAGLALMPITIIMFFLSSKFGALSGKYGPRLFMGFGPIIAGLGFLWMLGADASASYFVQILPAILVFGIGLSVTVAPLTSAILGSIEASRAGIGSAINNAIARIAGLLAIAFIGIVVSDSIDLQGFKNSVWVMSALLIAGGIISLIGIKNQTEK